MSRSYYRAPELVFEATQYTTSIDVWSLGCVMAEMLLGNPLFPGESAVDQLIEIIKILGQQWRRGDRTERIDPFAGTGVGLRLCRISPSAGLTLRSFFCLLVIPVRPPGTPTREEIHAMKSVARTAQGARGDCSEDGWSRMAMGCGRRSLWAHASRGAKLARCAHTRHFVRCLRRCAFPRLPFSPNHTSFKFPSIKSHPWPKVFRNKAPANAIDLVSKWLRYEPKSRLDPFESLAHPFFDELREPGAKMPNQQPVPEKLFEFTDNEIKVMQQKGLTKKLIPAHLMKNYAHKIKL